MKEKKKRRRREYRDSKSRGDRGKRIVYRIERIMSERQTRIEIRL